MRMKRVLVLGGSGMLGSQVADVLSREKRIELAVAVRDRAFAGEGRAALPEAEWLLLDAETATAETLEPLLASFDTVVNCIGVIKPYIQDTNPAQVERALRVNALFPHALGKAAGRANVRVLQIATDCVYSGAKGDYIESDAHDALDVYGKSKSLGEANLDGMHHLRCSIIGPELKSHRSLLDWFRKQNRGAQLTGFTNHFWNGVTTLHFGLLCAGIIGTELELPRSTHVIPSGRISKHEMLLRFQSAYARPDLEIGGKPAALSVDRTLATADPERNAALWRAAGYTAGPPAVPQMIDEMAAWKSRFADAVPAMADA